MEENDQKISSGVSESVSDDELIRKRKEKIVNFLKTRYEYVSYLILAFIVYLTIKIRTSNVGGLRDVTTGTWTLGPDLDPFLFLRWAKYIVENGTLFAVDTMRYVPLGLSTGEEYLLHPYMMAWFHKVASFFGSESVTHSAVLYPAFFFGITVIAFFLMTSKIFEEFMGRRNAKIIALIASFLLSVSPVLLPRTVAGIPEKESAAFFFMFMAFYFFVSAWKEKKLNKQIVLALLSGVFTAGMAHVWGGYAFIFMTIGPAVFIAFLMGHVDEKKSRVYGLWLLSSILLMTLFSVRYNLFNLLTVVQLGSSIGVLFVILFFWTVKKTNLAGRFKISHLEKKIPTEMLSVIFSGAVALVAFLLIFGYRVFYRIVKNVFDTLFEPSTTRLIKTVAENRQPFFNEWASSFGPIVFGKIPLTFWLLFVGSILLFYRMNGPFVKKERRYLTLAYVVFLFCLIFSRYSPDGVLNGTNSISLFVYSLGIVVLLATVGYYYYHDFKMKQMGRFKEIDFGILLFFVFFVLTIVAARAAVRTILMLVPTSSIIVAYFVTELVIYARKEKEEAFKIVLTIIAGVVVLSTVYVGYTMHQQIQSTAQAYVPSIYTQQWQKAMAWTRDNTPQDSVFGHWWDYGYWLQSIGERATVLDGGNAIAYWNHLMGRYALTGTSSKEGAEFLYAHKATHFLIDPTDIGKYAAFSSIGSDVNYDRASYIPTFYKNSQGTQETKNTTLVIYQGGVSLDEDIIYEQNGSKILLPKGSAGIGAIVVERDSSGKIVSNPLGVYVYQGQQYTLPMRYAFDGELIDFGSGIESGFFIFPRATASGNGVNIEGDGAMLYLSKRTVNSQLARLYLYGQDDNYFKLAHAQDDFVVEQIKLQSPGFNSSFLDYQGFRGPIKIWEISYPSDIELKEEFLETDYPEELLYG